MDMHADMRAQRFRPRTIGAAEIGAAENENAAGTGQTGHAPAPVQVLAGMVPEKGPERGLSATSQTSQQQIVPRADVVAARPAHEGAALPTDYAGGGVAPPHLRSATKPKKIGSCSWLTQAGAPMEAFWVPGSTWYFYVVLRPTTGDVSNRKM